MDRRIAALVRALKAGATNGEKQGVTWDLLGTLKAIVLLP